MTKDTRVHTRPHSSIFLIQAQKFRSAVTTTVATSAPACARNSPHTTSPSPSFRAPCPSSAFSTLFCISNSFNSSACASILLPLSSSLSIAIPFGNSRTSTRCCVLDRELTRDSQASTELRIFLDEW